MLPNLNRTEYLSVFAGTKAKEHLSSLVPLFEKFGAVKRTNHFGQEESILLSQYNLDGICHHAKVALVKIQDSGLKFGMEVVLAPDEGLPAFPNIIRLREEELKNIKSIDFDKMNQCLEQINAQVKFNELKCQVIFNMLLDDLTSPVKVDLLKFFNLESRLALGLGVFYGESKKFTISAFKVPDETLQAIKGPDFVSEFPSYLITFGSLEENFYFGDLFPLPPRSKDFGDQL